MGPMAPEDDESVGARELREDEKGGPFFARA